MIRKVIIVLLTLAAVGTALGGICSYMIRYPAYIGFSFPRSPTYAAGEQRMIIVFARGKLSLSHTRILDTPTTPWARYVPEYRLFGYRTGVLPTRPPVPVDRIRGRKVWAPFWFVVLMFAAYPALAFTRGPLRRWRRRRKGLCLKCGYNLTGNVSGVCPECGTKVEAP